MSTITRLGATLTAASVLLVAGCSSAPVGSHRERLSTSLATLRKAARR